MRLENVLPRGSCRRGPADRTSLTLGRGWMSLKNPRFAVSGVNIQCSGETIGIQIVLMSSFSQDMY